MSVLSFILVCDCYIHINHRNFYLHFGNNLGGDECAVAGRYNLANFYATEEHNSLQGHETYTFQLNLSKWYLKYILW